MSENELRRNQLGQNMRFYGDMRFKQLTLFLGASSLFIAGVGQYQNIDFPRGLKLKAVISIAGILFTSVMWVMEVRSTVSFFATRELAEDLWPRAKPARFIWLNSTNAVLSLHIASFCFWYWCAANWVYHRFLILSGGALLGILLAAFTVHNYLPAWRYPERPKDKTSSVP